MTDQPKKKIRIHQALDADLHADLKVEAARRRIPLHQLIEQWLAEKLETVREQGKKGGGYRPNPALLHGDLLTDRSSDEG